MNTFKVLHPVDFSPEITEQVIDLGMRSGIWQDSDRGYYTDQFMNPRNINIVCQNENGLIIGYILAKPHNEAVQDYLVEDPEMKKSEVGMFYVDIVIADKNRDHVGMYLIGELILESHRRGVVRFSMHARVSTGFSKVVQDKFGEGLKIFRRIEHYVDCNNESIDYMEIVVNPKAQ